MIILDAETINQYVLEVLTSRPNFNKAKNYTSPFKRFIKVLADDYFSHNFRLINIKVRLKLGFEKFNLGFFKLH